MENHDTCPPVCRRAVDRRNIDGEAEVIVTNLLRRPLFVRNISVKGAGVTSGFPIGLNQMIDLSISLPLTRDPIFTSAHVVWCYQVDDRLWESGLEFDTEQKLNFT